MKGIFDLDDEEVKALKLSSSISVDENGNISKMSCQEKEAGYTVCLGEPLLIQKEDNIMEKIFNEISESNQSKRAQEQDVSYKYSSPSYGGSGSSNSSGSF